MCALRAFDGDDQLKHDLLAQVKESEDAGNVVHGVYGDYQVEYRVDEDGWLTRPEIVGPWRGCAVGVIVHGGHYSYGDDFHGIPSSILRALEDVYERLNDENSDAASYPRRLLEAIPVGADLSNFKRPQGEICEVCNERHDRSFASFEEFLEAIAAAVAAGPAPVLLGNIDIPF